MTFSSEAAARSNIILIMLVPGERGTQSEQVPAVAC